MGSCAKLGAQCGGEGYLGPRCCDDGNECHYKYKPNNPKYRQCKLPPPSTCEDPEPGTDCYQKVMFDMHVSIHKHPDWFHGLTKDSGFKEFQEYEFMLKRRQSQCKMPCAPGTCYFVLRYEGCDTKNEWSCDEPNDSVAWKCCCDYFHNRV